MNLSNYNPIQDKCLVYDCIGDPIKELPGILSGFLLALVNNYRFKITGLDKSPFAEIFSSKIPWWETQWKDYGWKHGFLNLKNIEKSEIDFLKFQTIENKFYNTHILHFYSEDDLIPYILKNENYEENLRKLELFDVTNVYKILFDFLFSNVESQYTENLEFLIQNLKTYNNAAVICVDEKTELDEIFKVEGYDFIYVYCENQVVYTKIKSSLPNMNFSRIKIQNLDDENFTKFNKISKLLEMKFLTEFTQVKNFTENNQRNFVEKLINQE